MPDNPKVSSFRLPNAETLDAYVVELPGGRKVIRTREELTRDPRQPSTPPTSGSKP